MITATAVAQQVRKHAAEVAESIDPYFGWDEASRKYALEHLIAFSVTPGYLSVSTPRQAPMHLGESAHRMWPETARQAAVSMIDEVTDSLGLTGTINADNPHEVSFRFEVNKDALGVKA